MPSPTLRPHGGERTLVIRFALAIGLALLLVIGAWSSPHGTTEAHAALCLSPGATGSSTAAPSDVTAAEPVAGAETGIVVIAVVCAALLGLLLVRLSVIRGVRGRPPLGSGALPAPRAGPVRAATAPSLIRLSISRT